jgi:hypothetical protein
MFSHGRLGESIFVRKDSPCLSPRGPSDLATLLLWLGWLCSLECFTLKWSDFNIIEPCDGPTADLPLGCGSVDLCLGPETKSSRAHTVSVPVAYQTLSGYHCGKWFHQARRCCDIGTAYRHCPDLVFTHPAGTPWTSRFYQHEFFYIPLSSASSWAVMPCYAPLMALLAILLSPIFGPFIASAVEYDLKFLVVAILAVIVSGRLIKLKSMSMDVGAVVVAPRRLTSFTVPGLSWRNYRLRFTVCNEGVGGGR